MADAQKTIDMIFNGIDKTGAATQAALDNAKKFTSSLQNITQPIADFSIGAVKLEAGLLAAGLAMTVFAVKVAGDFDASFRQISTIIDANEGDLAKFKGAILDYAEGSTQPLDQITTALGNAIGSGVDWAQSLDLIATAEKLAVATRSDLDGTTKVLVSTLNSYGMELSDAGKLSDLFFKIIDEGDITMTDLADSFAKVAPIAKISGVSLEEVGAAIATLTAGGIKPAESIEYLRGAISNIISPSGQAIKLADELGINFNAAGLKADGLAGLLEKVAIATGGNAAQMKILWGDIGGFTAAATLAGPQADKFRESLKAMGDVAGATDAAFTKIKGSLEVATAQISSAFTVLLANIGTPLLDEFGGIATAIANIFKALSSSVKDGGLKDLVAYIESVFGDIQGSIETVAKNLPAALATADFSGFKGGIDAVITALKSLFGSIDLTTVDGLKTAIETAGVAFLGLSKYTAGVIETFEPLFNTLVAVGKGAKDADLDFLQFAGNIGGIATQLNIVMPLFTSLVGILAVKQGLGLITELRALPAALAAAGAAAGATGLAGALGTAGLAGAFGLAGYNLGTALNPAIDGLVSKISGTKTTLGGFIYDLINSEKEAKALGLSADGAAAGVGKIGTAIASAGTAAGAAQADFRKTEIAFQNTGASVGETNKAMLANFAASEKAATAIVKVGNAQKDLSTYAIKTVPIFDSLTGKISGYEQQLVKTEGGTVKLGAASDKAGKDLAKIASETEKAEKAQADWNKEIEKMKFTEKLAQIENQTKIMTAQIEGDAKKTVAAFESIGTSIKSTGDVLSTLFGNLKDFGKLDYYTQNKVTKQIDEENRRRDEDRKLQKELIDTQIAQMRAQTSALAKDGGLIKVDGTGLKPHLEAIMWELLKAIQVRVNKDGLKLLLGT
jgi:TP901 family phage tail tape measure protein